eukprot:182024-Amphidinium_carterae.1
MLSALLWEPNLRQLGFAERTFECLANASEHQQLALSGGGLHSPQGSVLWATTTPPHGQLPQMIKKFKNVAKCSR